MKKNLLLNPYAIIFIIVFGIVFAKIGYEEFSHWRLRQSIKAQKEKEWNEGIYEIQPDSVERYDSVSGEYVKIKNLSAGDTIWIQKPHTKEQPYRGSSKHYESDPMWREVQRHVDNDPYFKQW